ncbi:hypothetical protein FHX08_001211 [Rhizobium sp. BK529]|nr:hypothetical protein [Rhizobium sp. BK529]TCS09178.1 hypothetical protein EV281_1011059 [Rhizobium sp. BK418]
MHACPLEPSDTTLIQTRAGSAPCGRKGWRA